MTTKLSPSQLEMEKIELEISESDNIPIICFSVCFDLEIYDKLKNEYIEAPFDKEKALQSYCFIHLLPMNQSYG